MDSSSKFDPIVVVKDAANQRPAFFKRIRAPFSKLSLPNKKIAGAVLALLLVFGVGLGVFLAQRQTQLSPRASVNGVDLKIQPTALTVGLNQQFDIEVALDARQASASAAQVKITFDPQKLQLISTTLGSYMPVPLQAPQPGSGTVNFVVGTSTPRGGTGTLATLHFKALADASPTQIAFDAANTIVTVTGLNSNQAGDLANSSIIITHGDPQVSPSPDTVLPSTYFDAQVPSVANVGDTFNVTVKTRSNLENANLFVAKINFPANLLEVVSIDHTSSFVTSWAEEYYNNTTGQISLVGGVPNPGYKTSGAEVVFTKLAFRAKAAGNAVIDITDQSQIFSNATNTNIADILQDHIVAISQTRTSPSPDSCNTNSDCSNGQTCQWVPVCTGGQVNCTSVVHKCQAPNTSPSPSPSPRVSPSPSAGNCAVLKGDGNADCAVNLTDLSIMLSNFSANNPVPSGKQLLDFNNDNRVNSFDFSAMADKLFQLQIIRRRS